MIAANAKSTAISLDTACAITEVSRSTWRRRIAKGEIPGLTEDARGRTMLLWTVVKPEICVPIEVEDENFVFLADAGNADAQNDIGQLLLIAKKYRASFYWFQQAARQENPDAMQWLGHCHIGGHGMQKNDHLGLMWIAKAAALGHVIAQGQMEEIISRALDSPA